MNLSLTKNEMMLLLYDECNSDESSLWCQELIHDTTQQGEYFALLNIKKQLDTESNSTAYLNIDMSRALQYSKTPIAHSL